MDEVWLLMVRRGVDRVVAGEKRAAFLHRVQVRHIRLVDGIRAQAVKYHYDDVFRMAWPGRLLRGNASDEFPGFNAP